jgi:hypothetical protein
LATLATPTRPRAITGRHSAQAGQSEAGQGQHFHRAPDHPAADGADHAEQDPGRRGEQGGEENQRQRNGEPLVQHRRDLLAGEDGCAEAAVRQLVEEVAVLVPQRLVEAELGAEPRIGRGRPARADESASGVAGHERFQYERHRGDDHDQGNREEEASGDQGKHGYGCSSATLR